LRYFDGDVFVQQSKRADAKSQQANPLMMLNAAMSKSPRDPFVFSAI